MSSLLRMLQQLGESGDPYYQRAIKHAEKVKIHMVRRNSLLNLMLREGIRGFKLKPKRCYDNALTISLILENQGVKYVEGFVLNRGKIFSHAWISFNGRYYDPTYEGISCEFECLSSPIKPDEYVCIAEMTASYVWANCVTGGCDIEYLPPVPVTISMWGFDDSKRSFHAPDGIEVDSLERILKLIAVPR